MTSRAQFIASVSDACPVAGLDLAQQALWWAAKGDWARAHDCAQQRQGDPGCDWVHAHLHRIEGDETNARYWYRRAGRPVATGPVEQEWATIVAALLPPATEDTR